MSVTMLATHNVSPDSVECWSIPRHSQYSDYIITRSVPLLNDSLSPSVSSCSRRSILLSFYFSYRSSPSLPSIYNLYIYIYIPSSSHLPILTFLLFTHLTYIRTSRFRHNNRPPQISASTALLIYDFIQLPSTTPPTHLNTPLVHNRKSQPVS